MSEELQVVMPVVADTTAAGVFERLVYAVDKTIADTLEGQHSTELVSLVRYDDYDTTAEKFPALADDAIRDSITRGEYVVYHATFTVTEQV